MSLRDRIGERLRASRAFVACELLLVASCVALQWFGVIRNPTLLILPLGWLSLWLRRSGWRAVGLRRPSLPWRFVRTLGIAIAIGVAYDAVDVFALTPLLHRLTGEPLHVEALDDSVRGNLGALALTLVVIWIFAAFFEELAHRGYLLNRVVDLFGGGRVSKAGRAVDVVTVVAVVLVSALFGVVHRSQGVTGILDNGVAGLLFASLYLASGRNLWLPILVHGVIDTTSVVLLYCGFVPT